MGFFGIYPLVTVNIANWKMASETESFPMKSMVIFQFAMWVITMSGKVCQSLQLSEVSQSRILPFRPFRMVAWSDLMRPSYCRSICSMRRCKTSKGCPLAMWTAGMVFWRSWLGWEYVKIHLKLEFPKSTDFGWIWYILAIFIWVWRENGQIFWHHSVFGTAGFSQSRGKNAWGTAQKSWLKEYEQEKRIRNKITYYMVMYWMVL